MTWPRKSALAHLGPLKLRQWIADFFEPIRKKYFTKLGFPPAAPGFRGAFGA